MASHRRIGSYLVSIMLALFILPATSPPAVAGFAFKGVTFVPSGDEHSPMDVAVGSDGSLYAVDRVDHDIDVFTLSTTKGAYALATSFSGTGQTDGNLFHPQGIAVGNGFVYVADTSNVRVSQFTEDGSFVRTWGESGHLDGQFLEPSRIALDTSGNVYVSDGRRNDIQKFTPDGTFISGFKAETPEGPLAKVGGVAIAPDGSIFVTDEIGDRVVHFDGAGNWVSDLGAPGDLRNPVDVAIDSQGTIYVVCSHQENQTLQIYNADETFSQKVSGFNFPKGVGVDPKTNDVWVADTSNGKSLGYGNAKPKLNVETVDGAHQIVDRKQVTYFLSVNLFKPCEVLAKATITGRRMDPIHLKGKFQVGQSGKKYALSLNKQEAAEAKKALKKGVDLRVESVFVAECENGESTTKRVTHSIP